MRVPNITKAAEVEKSLSDLENPTVPKLKIQSNDFLYSTLPGEDGLKREMQKSLSSVSIVISRQKTVQIAFSCELDSCIIEFYKLGMCMILN